MKKSLFAILTITGIIGGTFTNFNSISNVNAAANTAVTQDAYTIIKPASTGIAGGFTDTKGHWAETAIEDAVKKGFVDGYPDGSFKPDGNVTRAEFLKMVNTAMKVDVTGGTGDDWYVPYVNAAVKAGFHQYSDFKTGNWNTPITRLEMARVAVRAATGDKNTDDKKWMYLATKAGLITGMDDAGSLGENFSTTRAQSVTIIGRILNVRSGTTLPTDKYAISNGEISWHKTNMLTLLPRYFSYGQKFGDIKADELKATGGDGNFVCEAEKFVVIDMEDPNDPNRKYLPMDAKWFDFKDYQSYNIPQKSYVILSFNKLVVKNNPYGITKARACTLSLDNDSLQSPDVTSQAGVLSKTSPLVLKDSFGYTTTTGIVTIKGNGEYNYLNGHIIPKGNLVGNGSTITFYKLGDFGQAPSTVYQSATDVKINQ
ncbi:S-layer homology domain-containing protein [Paenibacillus sp. 1P03SA]|uniref:S-layer homology domain-containing protein n=1 Tax=Paenibacillus sp. 1P03SA TaxID=3132294 RepID=UPI00399EE9EC